VRGKAEESELLQIPAARFRRALAEIPTVSETIVSALIMRRKRLQRDREFTGLRILADRDSREGHQLDDFLDKNHYPHRVIDAASEQGQTLAQRTESGIT
jgi:thioredoxin reductase (NADPH)